MNLLLTGATGFLGQNLCAHFTEQSAKLRILSRNPRQHLDNFSYPASFISWDHQSPNIESDILDVEAVIHLAGENIAKKRWSKKQKQRLWKSRIDSTQALVKSILASPKKPKVFICASAIGYYGDRWQEDISEDSTVGDGFLAELVDAWERACEPLKAAGIRLVNIRSGLVLGLNEGALKPLTTACDLGVLGNLGNGNQWMSWIHIKDWLHAVDFCLKTPSVSGPVNFVSPNPIAHKNFIQIFNSHLERQVFFSTPASLLKLTLGEMSSLFLDSQRVFPKKLLQEGFNFEFKTLDSALKNIFTSQDFVYESRVFLSQKKEDIFPFFTDPYSLEKISPPSMQLKVIATSDEAIKEGTVVSFKFKHFGIPLRGLTKVIKYEEDLQFTSHQTKGPFKRWHHIHGFTSLEGGTLVKDLIYYSLPFGWLGRLLAYTFVNKVIKKTCDYRKKYFKKRFHEDIHYSHPDR